MVWNAIGAIGGSALNLLGDLFGSGSNNYATNSLNRDDTVWLHDQQALRWKDATQWFNENGYTYLRNGLERAGYNPLMALGKEPMSGPMFDGGVMEENSGGYSFSLPQSIKANRALLRNTNADTSLKYAQQEETISRSNLENTQEILSNKEIPFKTRMMASAALGMEIDNMMKRAEIQGIKADVQLKNVQSNLSKAQLSEINHNIAILKNQKIISDKQAKYLLDHPVEAQRLMRAGMYTGVIGNIFGGNANASFSINQKK